MAKKPKKGKAVQVQRSPLDKALSALRTADAAVMGYATVRTGVTRAVQDPAVRRAAVDVVSDVLRTVSAVRDAVSAPPGDGEDDGPEDDEEDPPLPVRSAPRRVKTPPLSSVPAPRAAPASTPGLIGEPEVEAVVDVPSPEDFDIYVCVSCGRRVLVPIDEVPEEFLGRCRGCGESMYTELDVSA